MGTSHYNKIAITYDAIGNHLTYNGWTYTWQNGRQLAGLTDGTDTLSFKYDSDGIRTKKTVNGTATEYFLNGSTILAQKTGNDIMWFYYDHSGTRVAFEYQGDMYYYVYNAQGDVMYIADSNGYIVGGYQYDSWGKVINAFNAGPNTVATANPFRYRGYYYDSETELYYLNSRYYNPEWGRFINADGIIGANDDIISTNLFAYCSNNPINGYDPTGEWNASTFMKGLSIALVGVAAIATVATAGCAAPLLIATVAVVSGAACIGFGAAEIAESFTDHNVIRDDLMGGNEQLYNTVRTVTEVTATVSTIAVNVGAALKAITSPTNGIDTYSNLRKVNKGTGNQVHHIVEKRFADTLGIDKTNDMLSIALSKAEHQVYTNAWRAALPYGNTYSKAQILGAAVKIYAKSPKLLVAAVKTIL